MTKEEKIALLEDMLELESGALAPETELSSIDEYDSMAKLSLIVLMDDEFSKKLTGEQIREFKTVQDILDFMGE
jgi:acyl carrier protein